MCKIGDKMYKLRKYCWLLLLLFVSNNLYSQITKRSLSTVNAEFESGMEKMATLHNQLYVYGYGGANLQFGYSQFTQANGSRKLFIAKYNDTGSYLKSVILGGLGANINGDACTLGNNLTCYSGSYAGGYSENTTSFQPASKKGLFVTAIDSALKVSWRLFIQANDKFHCNLLCPDGKGNLIAAGYFSDSLGVGSFQFRSTKNPGQTAKNKDIFLLLINSSGLVVKAQTFGGPGNDYPTALCADARGNAIVSAVVADTVQLGDYYYPQQSNARCIVFKTNFNAHTSWVTAFSGAGVAMNGLKFTKSNKIVCGLHYQSVLYVKSKSKTTKINSSAEYNQVGILFLDTFGVLQTYTTEGSKNECSLTALMLDTSDQIYIAGHFDCTFTGLNKKNTSWSFKNIGYGDIFIAAYKPDLTNLYQRQIGGTQQDFANHLVFWKNKPVVCGNFKNDLQLASDSNVAVTLNIWGNYFERKDYYQGYAPGPYRKMMSLYYPGMSNYNGFVTDIIDDKSQLMNNFSRTWYRDKPFSEDAKWLSDVTKQSDTNCYRGNLRYAWIKEFEDINSSFGSHLNYWLNGTPITLNTLKNYSFDKTTYHQLIMESEDKCYRDTLSKTHVVIPQQYAVINYDRVKYPENVVLCKNDSICLTASNTKGLKYYWLVRDYKYKLDSANQDNSETKWIYEANNLDTIRKPSICISKKATVDLVIEKNNQCLESTSLNIEKDGLGKDDSLVYFFEDTLTRFCKGTNSPFETFKIRVLDKKTGFYRYPEMWVTIKINGANAITTPQTSFKIPIPDTGKISVVGSVKLGCEVYDFSLSRKIILSNRKTSITGTLSNCRSEDRIFSVDSGFLKYQWTVRGLPDTPRITYLSPWKIKVSGNSKNISVYAFADTTVGKECYVWTYKTVPNNPIVYITSSINPAQICPGGTVRLTAGNAKEYSWYPTGENTKSITAKEPGYYYCTIKDTGDCIYNTNRIEVIGTFKPDILVAPDDGICPGQEASIIVVAPKLSEVRWVNPASWGSNLSVKTSTPGRYQCEVKTCNITYPLTAEVVERKVDHNTLNFTHKLCRGQTLTLWCHDSETYEYNWRPVNANSQSIQINTTNKYVVQAKDDCDQWYDADVFDVVKTNGLGKVDLLDTLICGLTTTTIDLRNKYVSVDSTVSCWWEDSYDTSFVRTFAAGNIKANALIKNIFCTIPDTFKVNIVNHITPAIKIVKPSPICIGDTLRLEAQLNDSNANYSNVVWNFNMGKGAVKFRPCVIAEWYKALYSDTCGTVADSVFVNPVSINAQFTMDYDLATDSVTLTDKSLGLNIVKYQWQIDQKWKGENPILKIASPNKEAIACLLIENSIGCQDSVCKILPNFNDGRAFIPNVFYPTSKIDVNQRFKPQFLKNTQYKMLIYNRWGEKLFEGDASTNGWDGYYKGLRCMSGYYVYLIYTQYTDLNGNLKSKVYNGTVLLLE